ncbi:MAG: phosphoenolpyruvate hydrolase family protein [Pseudohongiellaceae bacterium]
MAKLNAKVAAHEPIFIASAGAGLVAKLLEKAGVDCINTFSGARLRSNGMGTMSMMWPILDSNQQTLDYTEQDIMPAITGDAFVCACINANDPLRDMRTVLERLKSMGVMSVSNIGPSISYVDKGTTIYNVLTKSGITFDNEVEMLALAKEMDMVTVALAFDMDDSVQVVQEARPDIFCFHAGTTQGGMTGYDSGETIAETAQRTEAVCVALRKIEPTTILVGHGAAMETPEDVQYMLNNTSCNGFWTGSSTERLPIERAVLAAAEEFRELKFPPPAGDQS